MPRTVIIPALDEGTTPRILGTLVDDREVPLAASVLEALTLTLYSLSDPMVPIINGRNKQNVLNTNGVTVDANGAFVWEIEAADLVILNDALTVEKRLALFEWTWALGQKSGKQEIEFRVKNLVKVP